jgi:hypothetical protein
MIFSRALLGQELILLGPIGLAMGLIYTYLRWRGQLDLLHRVWLPALLWAIFGPLDALVTIVGTWGAPWAEGNPLLRAFLSWDGWVGQVIYTFVWELFWAAVVSGLEALRRRLGGVWAYLLGAVQLVTLYMLAVGHFFGFLSWTPYLQPILPLIAFFEEHVPWLFSDSPMGFLLNWATALGAICTALHLGIAILVRRMVAQAPVASHGQGLPRGLPQGRAARPGQIAER